MDYYDGMLAGIAGSLMAGWSIGTFTPVALSAALSVAGLMASVLMYHGLFVRAPVSP